MSSTLRQNPAPVRTTTLPSVCHRFSRARKNRFRLPQMSRHQHLKIQSRLPVPTVPLDRSTLQSVLTSVLYQANLNQLVVASLLVLLICRLFPCLAAYFAANLAPTRLPQGAAKLAVRRNCVGMESRRREIRITVPCFAPRMEAFSMAALLLAPPMVVLGHCSAWMSAPEAPAISPDARTSAVTRKSFATMDRLLRRIQKRASTSALWMVVRFHPTAPSRAQPVSKREHSGASIPLARNRVAYIRRAPTEALHHGTKPLVLTIVQRIQHHRRALTSAPRLDSSLLGALNDVM